MICETREFNCWEELIWLREGWFGSKSNISWFSLFLLLLSGVCPWTPPLPRCSDCKYLDWLGVTRYDVPLSHVLTSLLSPSVTTVRWIWQVFLPKFWLSVVLSQNFTFVLSFTLALVVLLISYVNKQVSIYSETKSFGLYSSNCLGYWIVHISNFKKNQRELKTIWTMFFPFFPCGTLIFILPRMPKAKKPVLWWAGL